MVKYYRYICSQGFYQKHFEFVWILSNFWRIVEVWSDFLNWKEFEKWIENPQLAVGPNLGRELTWPGAWAGFLSGPHWARAPLGHGAGRREGPAMPAITVARRQTVGTMMERRQRWARFAAAGPRTLTGKGRRRWGWFGGGGGRRWEKLKFIQPIWAKFDWNLNSMYLGTLEFVGIWHVGA
jgi:hypothetical protein